METKTVCVRCGRILTEDDANFDSGLSNEKSRLLLDLKRKKLFKSNMIYA